MAKAADDRWDDEAQRELRAQVKRSRKKADVLSSKALALSKAQDRERRLAALGLLEEAVALGDRHSIPLALALLAEVRRSLGDADSTLAAYRRSIQYEREHPSPRTTVAARFVCWVIASEQRALLDEARGVLASDSFAFEGLRDRLLAPTCNALAQQGAAAKEWAARAIAERELALAQNYGEVLDVAYRVYFDRPGLERASYVLHQPISLGTGEPIETLEDLAEELAVTAHQLDAGGAVFKRGGAGLSALDAWLRGGPFKKAKRSWLVDHVAPGLGAYLGCVMVAEGARWDRKSPMLTSMVRTDDTVIDVFARGWAAVFDGQPLALPRTPTLPK